MKYEVHINCGRAYRSLRLRARKAAETTLSATETPSGELTVVLIGEEEVRSLNHRFSGLDKATDVLSFPSGVHDPQTDRMYYGDVVIAVPVAARQARRAGQSQVAEIQLLVIHGVLHLLGFDHGSPADRKRMWDLQRGILAGLEKTRVRAKENR